MSSRRSKTTAMIEHFLQTVGGDGCDVDVNGSHVKGIPVAQQCVNCGNIEDNAVLVVCSGCGCSEFNPVYELR